MELNLTSYQQIYYDTVAIASQNAKVASSIKKLLIAVLENITWLTDILTMVKNSSFIVKKIHLLLYKLKINAIMYNLLITKIEFAIYCNEIMH